MPRLEEDKSLTLAQRLHFEGHSPGPFWCTLSAEQGSINAEGSGIVANGTKTYLRFKVWIEVYLDLLSVAAGGPRGTA